MKTSKTLIALATTAVVAGGGTAVAATGSASQNAFSGDAEVIGATAALDVETPQSVNRVTFIYGGKRIKGRLTENDAEDRTKDWEATTRAKKSDRRPGRVIKFRVKACDGSGCSTARFQDVVERDD